MRELVNNFLKMVFPPACASCGETINGSGAVCPECFSKIIVSNSFYCPECRRRLPALSASCHKNSKFLLAACTFYDIASARALIHALKYKGLRGASADVSKIIRKYLEVTISEIERWSGGSEIILIPIPLHKSKIRARGFNQAELIARTLKDELSAMGLKNAEIKGGALRKTKRTPSQAEAKNHEERRFNVSGSFSVEAPEVLKNRVVMIVDDVFTSGATASEAVRVLKDAGAKKVLVFALAKA